MICLIKAGLCYLPNINKRWRCQKTLSNLEKNNMGADICHNEVYTLIVLELPEGKFVDDFDSLSVWCVEFRADFGNLRLEAP
jgi:hypothetical protein